MVLNTSTVFTFKYQKSARNHDWHTSSLSYSAALYVYACVAKVGKSSHFKKLCFYEVFDNILIALSHFSQGRRNVPCWRKAYYHVRTRYSYHLFHLVLECARWKTARSWRRRTTSAAPLCNLSVWEPRFGGFIWGWEPGWYHRGSAKGPRWHQLPPNPIGKTQVLAQSAADVKNHLLASLC